VTRPACRSRQVPDIRRACQVLTRFRAAYPTRIRPSGNPVDTPASISFSNVRYPYRLLLRVRSNARGPCRGRRSRLLVATERVVMSLPNTSLTRPCRPDRSGQAKKRCPGRSCRAKREAIARLVARRIASSSVSERIVETRAEDPRGRSSSSSGRRRDGRLDEVAARLLERPAATDDDPGRLRSGLSRCNEDLSR